MEDWKAVEHDILSRLDLRSEAEALGVRFSGSQPSQTGWLECHAIDREDHSPSAAICVAGDNGAIGQYTDLGADGKAISWWSLAATLGPWPSWREARAHYADQVGVKLPDRWDACKWLRWSDTTAAAWCQRKDGITVNSLRACGARLCLWPIKGANPFLCIALPGYLSPDEDPAGWAMYRATGTDFPAIETKGGKKIKQRKIHNLGGSRDGWIIAGGFDRLAVASIVYKVEGPSDALALAPLLPPDRAVVANLSLSTAVAPSSSNWAQGKQIVCIGDADKPGQGAAKQFAQHFAGVAESAVTLQLPYEIADDHGKDLRDWINTGGTLDQLDALPTEKADPAPPSKTVENFLVEEYTDENGGKKTKRTTIPIGEIAGKIYATRDNWPRDLNGMLFVGQESQSRKIPDLRATRILSKPSDLFAWLRESGPVRWTTQNCADATPVYREEMFSYLAANSPHSYEGIAYLPYYPPIKTLYEVNCSLPDPTGEALAEFIDRLNPETPEDRDLLTASLLTPGWGGLPGQRPAFIFTSSHGRGAGKTKTAEAIAGVWGGAISANFSKNNVGEFRSRLLDNSGLAMRCVLVDNVKGQMSIAEVESLITAKVIDGKRMYHGDFRRPNYLTWFITANTPSFSKDLADRSAVITIGKQRTGDFDGWVERFLREKRPQIIADILDVLQGPDKCEIRPENLDRWNAWQRAVLQKFANGNELAIRIKEVRPTVDADLDEASEICRLIEDFISEHTINDMPLEPAECKIGIPVSYVYEILRKFWKEEHLTDRAVRFRINELLGVGPLRQLKPNPSRSYGRTLIWWGDNREEKDNIAYLWNYEWCVKNEVDLQRNSEFRLGHLP